MPPLRVPIRRLLLLIGIAAIRATIARRFGLIAGSWLCVDLVRLIVVTNITVAQARIKASLPRFTITLLVIAWMLLSGVILLMLAIAEAMGRRPG